jgi:murein DD-endopeptidase MepM/ murein hydrolase activator NlpD
MNKSKHKLPCTGIKKQIVIITAIIFILSITTVLTGTMQRERNSFNKIVDDQKAVDKQNIEEVTRELRIFINTINERLGLRGRKKLEAPVDKKKIYRIDETDHIHGKGEMVKKQYGYINGRRVRLRAGNSTRHEVIGHCGFGEKVELVMKSDFSDRIGSMKAPWYLIRRKNGDEGWLFGHYIQKNRPTEEKRDTGHYKFIVPTTGRVTSKFGYRVHPVTRKSHSFHTGIDIAAPMGTPVKASMAGTVVKSGYYRNGYGNLIVIRHENNFATYYGHLLKRFVRGGDTVTQGQVIGSIDSTGSATGPHLHFEIRKGSRAMDPDGYLP